MRRVEGAGVAHHDSRAVLEPPDQEPALFVDREVGGAEGAYHAAVLEPGFGGLEERPEHGRVIRRFHETEMTGAAAVSTLGQFVDLGADPTYRFPGAVRDPVVRLRVLEIGILVPG